MNKGKDTRLRRSVSFDDDVVTGINLYRAGFLREGKEKRFGPAVNELLREILTQKNLMHDGFEEISL